MLRTVCCLALRFTSEACGHMVVVMGEERVLGKTFRCMAQVTGITRLKYS